MKCSCGGVYNLIEGMEGYFCDRCGSFKDEILSGPDGVDVSSLYVEERLKSIRGVPVNRITIGSESKGRLEISIPIYITHEEQKAIIGKHLDLMEYAKNEIERRGLDIMPARR